MLEQLTEIEIRQRLFRLQRQGPVEGCPGRWNILHLCIQPTQVTLEPRVIWLELPSFLIIFFRLGQLSLQLLGESQQMQKLGALRVLPYELLVLAEHGIAVATIHSDNDLDFLERVRLFGPGLGFRKRAEN